MTSSRSTDWIADHIASVGLPPFAGGETAVAAPAATAPPPAPAPAPAPAAVPAPAPAAAVPPPGQPPAAVPPAPQPGDPAAPAPAEPAAAEPPPWAQTILQRFDQLAPPQPDPMMVELGLAPPPPPGQPPVNPSQVAPQGQPQYQGQPAMPGQPQPGQGLSEVELVQQMIDDRAQQQAERLIEERVTPLFAQQDVNRRRGELQSLQTDFPELAQPQAMQSLFQRAQSWSTTLFGNPNAAREPGFLEICHLANKQLEAAQAAGAAAPAPVVPGQPGLNGEVPVEAPGAATPGAPQTPEQQLVSGIMAEKRGGGLDPMWVG